MYILSYYIARKRVGSERTESYRLVKALTQMKKKFCSLFLTETPELGDICFNYQQI